MATASSWFRINKGKMKGKNSEVSCEKFLFGFEENCDLPEGGLELKNCQNSLLSICVTGKLFKKIIFVISLKITSSTSIKLISLYNTRNSNQNATNKSRNDGESFLRGCSHIR